VCRFSGGFFARLTILPLQGFKVTYPIFEILMTLQTRLPDAFHHLVPNYNFQCQKPLKNIKFYLFGSEKCQLTNLVTERDWLIMTSYRLRHAFSGNSKQFQHHNSVHLSLVYTDYSFNSVYADVNKDQVIKAVHYTRSWFRSNSVILGRSS